MATTLKDIADRLRVSPSTVSRALSDTGRVSKETRARVLRVAEELGYVPNALARGLAGASTNIVGCVILELSNPFFAPLVQAIEDVADERGYVAIVSQSKRQVELEKRLTDRFRRIKVDGVIMTPLLQSFDHLEALKADGMPLISVGRRCERLDYVVVDDRQGAHLVGQHLIRLGHRSIGTLMSGEPYNNAEGDRLAGLHRFLEQAGLPYREEWTFRVGNNRIEGGIVGAESWLSMSEKPSAVFALNDMLALGFIHRVRQRGIKVPGDLAVVGFDDVPFAKFSEVALTTVAYPKYEMGRIAAEMLFNRIGNRDKVRKIEHILLQPELVIRQSCGG